MPLPADLPVVDHHCHLSPGGEGVAAAKRFRSAGGTHLFLATQQYEGEVPLHLEQYRSQFETTEALAKRIRSEAGVVVFPVVAPYPVDLISAARSIGLPAAQALQEEALQLAGRWVEEQRAVALGEVGRPHFPVDPEVAEAAQAIFQRALEVARDVGCPAVVHCEELDPDGFRALAEFAARASFPLHRLVKHYARTVLPPEARGGVIPSFLAARETVRSALPAPGPWFLETDFLDDPKRPGAVLDLATIPRRAHSVADHDPAMIDRLYVPFVESVEAVYGIRPVVPEPRGST